MASAPTRNALPRDLLRCLEGEDPRRGHGQDKAVYLALGILPDGVHLIRHSLDYASWKDRKALAAELKTIRRAVDAEAACAALGAFEEGPWAKNTRRSRPAGSANGNASFRSSPIRRRCARSSTPPTPSNPGHMRLRKIIKTRGHFPTDEAAVKLLHLALKNITKEWKMSACEWKAAMNQFAILFAERFAPQLHV